MAVAQQSQGGCFDFTAPSVRLFIVSTYSTMTAREQAKFLGCRYSSLVQFRQRLLAEGVLDPTKKAYQPVWPSDVLGLMERLAGRYTATDMWQALTDLGFKFTDNAVKIKATRSGWLRWSQGKIGMEEGLLTPEEIKANFEGRPADELMALSSARQNKKYNKPWYKVEYDYLHEEVGRISPGAIGNFLGRSERSVRHKMTQFGLSMLENQGHLTIPIIAEEMGVRQAVVERWIKKGWLNAFVPPGAKRYLVIEQVEFDVFKKKLTDGDFLEDGWCKICNGHFKKRRSQSKKLYCSEACKHKAVLSQQRKRAFSFEKAQVMVDCVICGKEFVYGRQRYTCSVECKEYRIKQLDKIKKRLKMLVEALGRDHPMVIELRGSQEEYCRTCGTKISSHSGRRAYCSKACATKNLAAPTLEPKSCGYDPCSRTFTPHNNFQKYCSSLCKIESMIARGINPGLEVAEQFCKECGSSYWASKQYKYCSDDCREKGHLKTKRGRETPWEPEVRDCLECEASFTQIQWNQRYCSVDCRNVNKSRNAKSNSKYVPAPKLDPIDCEFCRNKFQPFSAKSKFCSAACRRAIRRAPKPEEATCEICRAKFQPTSIRQTMCSLDCRREKWRKTSGECEVCYRKFRITNTRKTTCSESCQEVLLLTG